MHAAPTRISPDELRTAYLEFFRAKGHTVWPSDSLVPSNDPTLLFTGAGMNQFKEMFLGVGNLPFRRAVTSQKCLRTGDLDNVGRTHYHHTFFEMLGNFSFGDYFKLEAIVWQWEFLTRVLEIPAERLRVSVYADDEEAREIWIREVGLPAERIWRLGPKSNFWPANAPEEGPNGPCGPCTEIFYDFGSPGAEADPDAERYCELGNIVFTEFQRTGRNRLEPLPQKNIDTGMGFERILAVLHGVRSNFETPLFLPILRRIGELRGIPYRYQDPLGALQRRIADHVRAAVFLIADGVKPSHEGRGYVVRRILRRAVRDGIALGIDRPFLHELVPVVVAIMGRAYPEVKTAERAASGFIRAEEEKFRGTYAAGMALLDRALEGLAAAGSRTLPGDVAFQLYDTHGFPLDLCEQILAERGFGVDRGGFERCMEEQRARSREGSAMGGEVFAATAVSEMKRDVPPTEFLGYEREEAESTVAAIVRGETRVEEAEEGSEELKLVARATPFYAEAGGQVGDTGVIEGPEGRFRVQDTRRVDAYILHLGVVERGRIRAGDRVVLRVDASRRAAIRRNHTATHLLHAALREVLGTHVTQAGSLVAPDRLRFDFTHPRALAPEELERIEARVNAEILRDTAVETQLRDLEEAKRAGAMALFGEKYAERVRVVAVGGWSMELCGGTHVRRAGEIGPFLVTQETSVASGVRRIEAVTGEGALAYIAEQRRALRRAAEALRVPPASLAARIEELQAELRGLQRKEGEQRRREGLSQADALLASAGSAGGVKVVVGAVEGDDPEALRALADEIRKRAGECVLLVAGRGSSGVALLSAATPAAVKAGIKAGDLVRGFALRLGGKGGGKPDLAQGRAPAADGLAEALHEARAAILEGLASR
jgi:alanyl-tRNA synthetase